MTRNVLQARLDGQIARLRGEATITNPHPFGSDCSLTWQQGWQEIDTAPSCFCGARLSKTNKSGRCHLCATRDANGLRELPADFAEHAVDATNSDLMERYNCCADIISRWRRESGVLSKKCRRSFAPPPADFVRVAADLTKRELRARYHRADPTINRWLQETGARCGRYSRTPAPLPEQSAITVPPEILNRSVLAAKFLSKFGPVSRCGGDGTFNPRGDYWRRGHTILCAQEVIARALRNGWNPDAWREVRAA
jgi:hypothetical protein